jgi:hypothetical protein
LCGRNSRCGRRTAATRAAHAAGGKTFVLVHGAWHGGWCWGKIAATLRGRGQPLNLKNKFANGLPTTYISCAEPAYAPLNASKEWKTNGIKMVEIKTGHDAMVTMPDKLTDMLDADSV